MSGKSDIMNMGILKPYLSSDGLVDYNKLKEDKWIFDQIEKIENTNPNVLNHEQQFAFYLNAYNLLTVKNVLQTLAKNPKWNGNKSYISKIKFFYLKRFKIGNSKINLYNLENKILRKKFKDPRIHFAINCASKSCPFLPSKLFTSGNLNDLLEELTSNFINDVGSVYYNEDLKELHLNMIFKWYKKDFEEEGGVLEFIKKYWKSGDKNKLNKAILTYKKYDWTINSNSLSLYV